MNAVAYTLTLSRGERQAIDMVGNRYAHGHDLWCELVDCMPADAEWGDPGDMTFQIPEHVAWNIADISEQCEGRWDMFGTDLAMKMMEFVDNIV